MDLPLVSICVPTRDRAAYLRESLSGILAQTYPHIEVIVSDNWSSDETPQLCAEFAARDARLRVIRPPQPLGLYRNHNFAFKASRGGYVCFFHDDDRYAPTVVERYVGFLQREPRVALVCADYDRIDGSGAVIERRRARIPPAQAGLDYIDRTLRTGRSSVALSGTMVRRAALPDPPFDEAGTIGFTDIVTWFVIAESAEIGHIGEVLWAYRSHPQANSQRRLAIAREHSVTLQAFCDGFERRHPDERRRVARWREFVRRFRFWALAYELADRSASSVRATPSIEDEMRAAVAEMRRSARGPLERSTLWLIEVLPRLRLGRSLGLGVRYARFIRTLVWMR